MGIKNRRLSWQEMKIVGMLRDTDVLGELRRLGNDTICTFLGIWLGEVDCTALAQDMYYSRNRVTLRSYAMLPDEQYAAILYKRRYVAAFPVISGYENPLLVQFLNLVHEGTTVTLGELMDADCMTGGQYDALVTGETSVCIRGGLNTGKVALFDGYLLYCVRHGIPVVVSDGYAASWVSDVDKTMLCFAGGSKSGVESFVRAVGGKVVFATTSPELGVSWQHYALVRGQAHAGVRVVMVSNTWASVSGIWKEVVGDIMLVNMGRRNDLPSIVGITRCV